MLFGARHTTMQREPPRSVSIYLSMRLIKLERIGISFGSEGLGGDPREGKRNASKFTFYASPTPPRFLRQNPPPRPRFCRPLPSLFPTRPSNQIQTIEMLKDRFFFSIETHPGPAGASPASPRDVASAADVGAVSGAWGWVLLARSLRR